MTKIIYHTTAYDVDGEFINETQNADLQRALHDLVDDLHIAHAIESIHIVTEERDETPHVEEPTVAETLLANLAEDACPRFIIAIICEGLHGQLLQEEIHPGDGSLYHQRFVFPDGSGFWFNHDTGAWGPERPQDDGEG
jgi:hypothetical protein